MVTKRALKMKKHKRSEKDFLDHAIRIVDFQSKKGKKI